MCIHQNRLDEAILIRIHNIPFILKKTKIQSTLVISTSVISNNRLSRRENLVLALTQKSKIRLQNIVEKRRNCSWGAISPLFHNIFNIYFLVKESNYIVLCKFWLFKLFFSSELHI